MGELEAGVEYLKGEFVKNRRSLFWLLAALIFCLLLVKVREVTTLLFAAYGIALLLDPILNRLEQRNISRTISLLAIGGLVVVLTLILLGAAIPALAAEYSDLVKNLPTYIRSTVDKVSSLAENWLGVSLPSSVHDWASRAKQHLTALGVIEFESMAKAVSGTLLRGYSLALTLINLFLLPFFVFYIARDLSLMHIFFGRFLTPEARKRVSLIGNEVLGCAYAFFKGQITVCLILAVVYAVGLSLAGMPWAVVIGTLTGLFNIVPYLGVGSGFVLSLMITLSSEPTLLQFGKILAVFTVGQLIEGNWLTPKIVGESVGIHPLGVMVALIVGGQLFGLLGLILAIPAAASIGVFYAHTMSLLEDWERPPQPRSKKKKKRKG